MLFAKPLYLTVEEARLSEVKWSEACEELQFVFIKYYYSTPNHIEGRSQWPRGIRRRYTAATLCSYLAEDTI
jgi:hypothetical protein